MSWQTWLGSVFTFINLMCAVIYVFAPRRHHHDWSSWCDWIISQSYSTAEGVRYRHCNDCKKVEKQESGWHNCALAHDRRPCSHLEHLNMSETARLEKELGL